MKRVRAFDRKNGEYAGIKHAEEITPPLRYAFRFACLSEDCEKTYHWRNKQRREGNAVRARETFVENHKSEHKPGCRYDFEKIASRHRDVAFYQNGAFHLRVNFPLGGARADIDTPYRRLTPAYITAVSNKDAPMKPGLSSLPNLTAFLEKEFGSLEAEQTDILKLQYQGRDYLWNRMFVPSDGYEGLLRVPMEAISHLTESRLAVVKILHESEPNAKGKRRFSCQAQDAKLDGRIRSVRPTIVCENDDLASTCSEMMLRDQAVVVAARPYTQEAGYRWREIPVALYIRETSQLAQVSADKYWRARPAQQLGFDFTAEP